LRKGICGCCCIGGLAGPRESGFLWLCEVLGLPSSLRLLPCEVEGRASLGGDGPLSSFPTCLSKLACFFLSVFLVLKLGKGLSQLMVVGERGSAGRMRSLAVMQVSLCHGLDILDCIVAAMKQEGPTYVLIAIASQAAD
jgi:hypothetical protein